MSAADNDEARVAESCCASCGKSEVDDMQLKKCDVCGIATYCSGKCQKDHRSQHEAMCKKLVAIVRDVTLFRQPESTHLGDCPICCLPFSLNLAKSTLQTCCSKVICNGCQYANKKRECEEKLQPACPFCRQQTPAPLKHGNLGLTLSFVRLVELIQQSQLQVPMVEEVNKNAMKRADANDPFSMCGMGRKHYNEGDYESAVEFCTNAAESGDVDAHYNLSVLYEEGKAEAAIAGHPTARHNLGCDEWKKGRIKRAVKHLIIAANLGHDGSIQALKEGYKDGKVGKEDFAAALRAHQAAVDDTKSPQREAAAKFCAFLEDNFSALTCLSSFKKIDKHYTYTLDSDDGNDEAVNEEVTHTDEREDDDESDRGVEEPSTDDESDDEESDDEDDDAAVPFA
ncbi:hypothetical protein QTG54_014428 [Skeletonema marinoi]|uniref:MYND-type domain-containing protein n=1 Tax=Skeletonema marinoi TaxID=267567 RepID=A0AAD9D6V5_9STRA|nr:hypothetical protein QTG54_014428 [Skeletonema marinoi]